MVGWSPGRSPRNFVVVTGQRQRVNELRFQNLYRGIVVGTSLADVASSLARARKR